MPRTKSSEGMDPTFAAANAAYLSLKELGSDQLAIAVGMLSQRLGLAFPVGQQKGPGGAGANTHPGGQGDASTPKEFIKGKKPTKEIERVTCLAYFLVHHRDTSSFKGKDIADLNTEARGPAFSNLAVHLDNATKGGYLTSVGGGSKGLTARGEALVEALPDREAVTAALEANPTRARRKTKRSRKT